MGISQDLKDIPLIVKNIGEGDIAIRNTVKEMGRIIEESSNNYYVRKWAEKILEPLESNLDLYRVVERVFEFLVKHTKYLQDIHGMEFIKTPPLVLQELERGEVPQLDCDDYTVTSLSLLKSVGFPVAIRIIATKSDREFDHVYGLVRIKNKWCPLDLTISQGDVGTEFPYPTRKADYLIFKEDGVGGFGATLSEDAVLSGEESDYIMTFKDSRTFYWYNPDSDKLKQYLSDYVVNLGIYRPVFSSRYQIFLHGIKRKISLKSLVSMISNWLTQEGFSTLTYQYTEGEIPLVPQHIKETVKTTTTQVAKEVIQPITEPVSKVLQPLAFIVGGIALMYVISSARRLTSNV